jgi:hypothetical protein
LCVNCKEYFLTSGQFDWVLLPDRTPLVHAVPFLLAASWQHRDPQPPCAETFLRDMKNGWP